MHDIETTIIEQMSRAITLSITPEDAEQMLARIRAIDAMFPVRKKQDWSPREPDGIDLPGSMP